MRWMEPEPRAVSLRAPAIIKEPKAAPSATAVPHDPRGPPLMWRTKVPSHVAAEQPKPDSLMATTPARARAGGADAAHLRAGCPIRGHQQIHVKVSSRRLVSSRRN